MEEIKGRTQNRRHGLGFLRPKKTEVSEREKVKRFLKEAEEAKRVAAFHHPVSQLHQHCDDEEWHRVNNQVHKFP